MPGKINTRSEARIQRALESAPYENTRSKREFIHGDHGKHTVVCTDKFLRCDNGTNHFECFFNGTKADIEVSTHNYTNAANLWYFHDTTCVNETAANHLAHCQEEYEIHCKPTLSTAAIAGISVSAGVVGAAALCLAGYGVYKACKTAWTWNRDNQVGAIELPEKPLVNEKEVV